MTKIKDQNIHSKYKNMRWNFLTGNDPLLFRTFFQTNIHFVGANGPLEGLSLFVESNWCWQESDFTSKFRRFYSWCHIYNYIGNIKMIWSDCFFPIPYCARISPQFVGKSVLTEDFRFRTFSFIPHLGGRCRRWAEWGRCQKRMNLVWKSLLRCVKKYLRNPSVIEGGTPPPPPLFRINFSTKKVYGLWGVPALTGLQTEKKWFAYFFSGYRFTDRGGTPPNISLQ